MHADKGQEQAEVQPDPHTDRRETLTGLRVANRAAGITHPSFPALSLGFLTAGSTKTFQLVYLLL